MEDDTGHAVIELFPVTEENVVVQDLEDEEASEDVVAVEVSEAEVEAVLEVEVEASEVLVVRLVPAYARAFVRRAQNVVSAGRPPCQFCGGPIDPEGHLCPRANGFKRITV